MRLPIASANRASIVLMAVLLASCSNTSPGSQALPLGSPGAEPLAHRPGGSVDVAVQYAYVANFSSGNVSAFAIAADGALTPVGGSPFKADKDSYGLAIDPVGRFVYVTNFGSSNVSAFAVDAASGALKKVRGSPFVTGAGPIGLAVDPTGKFAYISDGNSNNVSAYAIDASTGALTPIAGSPFRAGHNPYGVTVDGKGKFVYVPGELSNSVAAFAIDATTGALTPVKGSPFAAGIGPESVTLDPSGKFAYVASWESQNVYGFAVDAASGALKPLAGSPFADQASGPAQIVVTPTGRYAYLTNSAVCGGCGGGRHIGGYSIDSARGTLTPLPGSPFKDVGIGPLGEAIDPRGKFVYITNIDTNNISVYAVASSGALKKVKGSPFAAGTTPAGISVCRVTAGKCIPAPL
ncbi:MAG: beta-propeller fold lactonase family protein [Candidatus Cybelea sp.]|jgi:6-phosphogluconolactonase